MAFKFPRISKSFIVAVLSVILSFLTGSGAVEPLHLFDETPAARAEAVPCPE